jgi:hypothetical protein
MGVSITTLICLIYYELYNRGSHREYIFVSESGKFKDFLLTD